MTNAEAIETLRANYPDACFEQLREAVDKAIKALEEQEWIPCSERLPEENMTRVLTTVKTSRKGLNVRSGTYHDGLFMNDNGDVWEATDKELKAWMPLPEPCDTKTENVLKSNWTI